MDDFHCASCRVERVEPPFWWVGFNQPVLQLLVYGQGIGEMSPAVNRPGVTVGEVATTGNPNYLFVHLQIDTDAEAGQFDIVFSGDEESIVWPYRLDQRNPDPNHTRGFSPPTRFT